MASIKDQAIVLRRLDYSETSQVLVFLTRGHGPRRLIAKGIKRGTKKKFATGIDLLERGEVVFLVKPQSDSALGLLTEWRQTDPHLGLRRTLDRWYAGQYAAEITAVMTEEADADPALFDALGDTLMALAADEEPLSRIVRYQSALLVSAGLWPDLTRCMVCDRPAPAGRAGYYAPHEGGLICRDCQSSAVRRRKFDAGTLSALREGGFTPETLRGAFRLLDYTIAHHIGRQLALARLVVP